MGPLRQAGSADAGCCGAVIVRTRDGPDAVRQHLRVMLRGWKLTWTSLRCAAEGCARPGRQPRNPGHTRHQLVLPAASQPALLRAVQDTGDEPTDAEQGVRRKRDSERGDKESREKSGGGRERRRLTLGHLGEARGGGCHSGIWKRPRGGG